MDRIYRQIAGSARIIRHKTMWCFCIILYLLPVGLAASNVTIGDTNETKGTSVVPVPAPPLANFTSTPCPPNMGYPEACPRPGDPPDRTRCCRYYHKADCCQDRASTVCGVLVGHRSHKAKFDYDPGPTWKTMFCPQPDDYNGQTVCCYDITAEGHQISCCGELYILGIAAAVLGVVLFIFACAGSVCLVQIKRGRWRWIQTRTGNYTLVHAEDAKLGPHDEYLTVADDWE